MSTSNGSSEDAVLIVKFKLDVGDIKDSSCFKSTIVANPLISIWSQRCWMVFLDRNVGKKGSDV